MNEKCTNHSKNENNIQQQAKRKNNKKNVDKQNRKEKENMNKIRELRK